MIRILLVEDDPVIRDTTSYFLNCQQNFEVVCADTGGEALSHAREKFDVILMDILLPDTNGMELCQRLRSWYHCPIIFTSCLDDTDTVVRALELGGDDFLTKPYNHKVLLARIMANIRRVQMDAAEPSVSGYHCAAFTLDSNSHCVEKDGRSIHLAEDVNLEKIAQATAGCVGADLANLVNEAALRAVRLGRSAVNQNDLLAAFETVIAGSEKKGTVITDEEKRIIAYHEVGHALVAAKQKNAQPVSKITIVPHTQGALGYTLHLPEEEKFLMSREDILAEIRTLLAGRSSEEVVCHTMTSGAANDIERATEMARNLVARFGMCEEFDMMALGSVQNQYLDGTYSMSCAQETYAAADRAVIAIIRQCHEDARRMLEENRELLDKIAAYLLKKETITGQEMMAIIEGRDPETVDNYGATREEKQPLFRPSSPEVIEAPAKHIHIVSEPVPSPEEPQTPEEKSPEEAQPDHDPEESEQK